MLNFRNTLILLGILIVILLVILVICCIVNKDKYKKLHRGKRRTMFKSSAGVKNANAAAGDVKCNTIPRGGCSFFACDQCKNPDSGYCAKNQKQCEGWGDEAGCGGMWCVNGKRADPLPPAPSPTPIQKCPQSSPDGFKYGDMPTPKNPREVPDIIGYYGNAEKNAGQMPLSEIPEIYNIIVLTFLEFDEDAKFYLVIQGVYGYGPDWGDKDHTKLITDAQAWKKKADPWGRDKHIFVSLGGATFQPGTTIPGSETIVPGNDNYPSLPQLMDGFDAFTKEFDDIFTGIDLDFEGESRDVMYRNINKWSNFLHLYRNNQNFKTSVAPEADDRSIMAYIELAPKVDYFMIQYYNNGPSQIEQSFLSGVNWLDFDSGDLWMQQSHAWQHQGNTSFAIAWEWYTMELSRLISNMIERSHDEMRAKIGPLVPASMAAATLFNCWDFYELARGLIANGGEVVGSWCIEQDKLNGYVFRDAMLKMLEQYNKK